ncbi:nuclear transport factor 2 family protein [Nocardioides rotundus]|uniref:nuclear transport factor 2 family protein n=1 Tax=Nocardioides rotundus TaxID=1774216 RepID=UPI001CBC0DA9|nr:nuclear transport factor 2 family protein [Nocardioides rotundus]UAL31432.1 nuclear transport factor 2 family protein [Nocardioides rotundus]
MTGPEAPLSVHELATERACSRLSARYALYADRGHASAIAELFTPEGIFATPAMTLTGREQIRQRLAQRQALERLRTIHQLTGILIDPVGPDEATGWVTLCLYRRVAPDATAPATDTTPVLLGHYQDRYVRTDDGWLIAERHQHVSFADPTDPEWNVD